ncbi:PREDICTED: trem-like transcript 4 protein [Dipodomys ordii]|uniref:Trem-like transcript 4 protein n=1 Tax=Dipodomys ordii TaxID=10020 RepID=A0A1S3FEL4_DIPOR|nr:PREDICTED: trem-like transcript 4 protein [Dipodomys ordii]
MAWGCPLQLLYPVLMVLLASGSWDAVEEVHEVVGQTLSVRCWYPAVSGPYAAKTWCRRTGIEHGCNRMVTTSRPRTAAEVSRFTIWDDPGAGFFIVTVAQLREEDSGVYSCGSYNPFSDEVTAFRNISLVVAPVLTASPSETTDPSTLGFEHRNSSSPLCGGWTSPRLLVVSVSYGLLAIKGLALSALCVLLGRWRCQG